MKPKIHLIAIGGSVMHNLARALHANGYEVTGSDDEIHEPSYTRLKTQGLLPAVMGWDTNRIHKDLKAVILGMHARADNPELQKARALQIPVYSFPAFFYEATQSKTRIVIGGSHGKTSITAMILHVFKAAQKPCDFLVGAQLQGFDTMVQLSDADCAVFEGDEYLASALDPRPKFHLYRPHIAVLSGIAWDHINVFPTFENYLDQFRIFIKCIEPGGLLLYCEEDAVLTGLVNERPNSDIRYIPYKTPPHSIKDKTTYLNVNQNAIPLSVFGTHNLQNLEAAHQVCKAVSISDTDFYKSIQVFQGASKRLEPVFKSTQFYCFKDFAHSPSKLTATVKAVRQQFTDFSVFACLELHTFSSLNEAFLSQYQNTLNEAHIAFVYFNPKTLLHKKLKPITKEQVKNFFNRNDLIVFTESNAFKSAVEAQVKAKQVLLLMSSGTFDGIQIDTWGTALGEKVGLT